MKTKNLRIKSVERLQFEVLNLLREQLNLRIQIVSNQFRRTHLLKQIRRDIARIKTILAEKASLI